ncbi:MAG: polyphosphate:AMP phosphotransferase [Nevskiaceae bacterium]
MFESVEKGPTVTKAAFEKQARKLQAELLEAQRELREVKVPVIVIVSGVETAGKSQAVKRLNEWLDARNVQSVAFWDESDEERERPFQWRFWRQLPAGGTIAILFGSWYTQPIVQRAHKDISRRRYDDELAGIAALERTLTDNGALLVKLWFHVSKKEQKRRLKDIAKVQKRQLTPYEKAYSKQYDRFLRVSEEAIRATDGTQAPWHLIDATDRQHRELAAGRVLLEAIRERLKAKQAVPPSPRRGRFASVLDTVDLAAKADARNYPEKLEKYQARLNKLAWRAREQKVSTVLMFEGWDAAGKGGAIRRVVAAIDARLVRVIPIAAPTDEERAHHYLWRFWRHLPRGGYFTIYDRSWYGRVLVERVEGFAQPHEWRRAYAEINEFERQLTDRGICLCKFWLHVSPEEQLRRFNERARTEYKKHKITEEDWRNRDKWGAYTQAVNEMVARTSTDPAPWTLVAANDKKLARLTVLKTACDALERALDRPGRHVPRYPMRLQAGGARASGLRTNPWNLAGRPA